MLLVSAVYESQIAVLSLFSFHQQPFSSYKEQKGRHVKSSCMYINNTLRCNGLKLVNPVTFLSLQCFVEVSSQSGSPGSSISRICHLKSFRQCPLERKCVATGLGCDGLSPGVTWVCCFCLEFWMLVICSLVLIWISRFVSPICYRLQYWQLIQYTKFLVLHVKVGIRVLIVCEFSRLYVTLPSLIQRAVCSRFSVFSGMV